MTSDPVNNSTNDAWEAGAAAMNAAYGPGFADIMPKSDNPYLRDTVEHLFGEVWARPGLSIRDRRLLVIGATAFLGRSDLIRIQVLGALRNGELNEAELDEAALQLAYYVGWGNATAVNDGFRQAINDHKNENSSE